MTKKEEDLLIKETCARMMYGVKGKSNSSGVIFTVLRGGNYDGVCYFIPDTTCAALKIDEFKLFLRPMSSMTEEEMEEWVHYSKADENQLTWVLNDCYLGTEWLNAHHFDYRGWIDKGLALKAVYGMYDNCTDNKKLKYINEECGTYYTNWNDVNWNVISRNSNLSFDFMREFKRDLRWNIVLQTKSLPESFIEEMYDCIEEVCWNNLTRFQHLSEDFMEKYKEKINWSCVSEYQKLSEDFMRKHKDLLNWKYICVAQKLSEDFIREFKNYVDWDFVSKYQKLSEDFIIEFKHEVNWEYISRYQKLSLEFVDKYYDSLHFYLVEDSWINKDTEFLKQKVIDTGLYKCYDDYFIAYKGIRSDRYSAYNFQYQYMTGETYESFCDCSDNENSFGLSVWTESDARSYCCELVIKVKVKYEDVGRVVHNGGKIRCKKFTVLT